MTTLLEALTQIKRRPVRLDHGICENVRAIDRNPEIHRQLWELMAKWPDAVQDNRWYPVEGDMSLYMYAVRDRALWQNPRRIALLDWLIKELEK